MTTAKIALLPDRSVISVAGEDAGKLLQGIITNDMDALEVGAVAIHAGLLTPQGKILHEFFVHRRRDNGNGYLLETARASAGELTSRLALYKLRAKVEIKDVSSAYSVAVLWGDTERLSKWLKSFPWPEGAATVQWFTDPRHPDLGVRLLLSMVTDWIVGEAHAEAAPAEDYHAHRVTLGVPEGGRDYPLGDAFPHEADFDLFHGVSFTKGCFVGQEVVARMQNKSVVRKRVVRVEGSGLSPGAEVRLGEVAIGTVGSAFNHHGLALVRIDRVVEAIDSGSPVTSGGQPVTVDPEALARYRDSVAIKTAGE